MERTAALLVAQAKAKPIEALEMDEQIAFWNGIKEMFAPQTAQAENMAQPTVDSTEEVGPFGRIYRQSKERRKRQYSSCLARKRVRLWVL